MKHRQVGTTTSKPLPRPPPQKKERSHNIGLFWSWTWCVFERSSYRSGIGALVDAHSKQNEDIQEPNTRDSLSSRSPDPSPSTPTMSRQRAPREFQAQCKADGQLFGMKACQKISCGTPYVLPSTDLVVPSSPRRSVEYGDKAKYKCSNGFTIGGRANGQTAFEVTCQDDGVLTDPKTCEPVRCGSAPHVLECRSWSIIFVKTNVFA